MILITSTCKEKLHELEFVKPVEKILEENKIKFFVKHFSELNEKDLAKADKIIICGTSLKDNEFLNYIQSFTWIDSIKKPILGICAGMQIIALIFGAKTKKKTEIGFYKENFTKNFLELKREHEVYHLHNNCMTLPKQFKKYTTSKIPQAIKHISKPIYGVLFHPEVRNKNLIENFIKL